MKIIEVVEPAPEKNTDHPIVRAPGSAAWGYSHEYSGQITGEAAKLLRLLGYRQDSQSPQMTRLAVAFLDAINQSPGAPETLYHGFQNRRQIAWRIGMRLTLPLMAAAGTIDTASYGMRLNPADNEGPPTVFEFPAGTPMAGYTRWKPRDAKEFGYTWTEALVAGKFVVTHLRQAKHYDWRETPYDVVTLRQTAVFDPQANSWRNK